MQSYLSKRVLGSRYFWKTQNPFNFQQHEFCNWDFLSGVMNVCQQDYIRSFEIDYNNSDFPKDDLETHKNYLRKIFNLVDFYKNASIIINNEIRESGERVQPEEHLKRVREYVEKNYNGETW